jgi:Homeodomain-like domain
LQVPAPAFEFVNDAKSMVQLAYRGATSLLAMSELSVKEAAELVHRSLHTVYRWRRQGVNIRDRDTILQHSRLQDIRARGKARERLRQSLPDTGKSVIS